MHAIEFETFISNNSIIIPQNFNKVNNIKAKVTVHFEDSNTVGNYDKTALINIVEKIKKLEIFKDINDSVSWQRELRNEWE